MLRFQLLGGGYPSSLVRLHTPMMTYSFILPVKTHIGSRKVDYHWRPWGIGTPCPELSPFASRIVGLLIQLKFQERTTRSLLKFLALCHIAKIIMTGERRNPPWIWWTCELGPALGDFCLVRCPSKETKQNLGMGSIFWWRYRVHEKTNQSRAIGSTWPTKHDPNQWPLSNDEMAGSFRSTVWEAEWLLEIEGAGLVRIWLSSSTMCFNTRLCKPFNLQNISF